MRILMNMATKNIYVADSDVELFDTASQLAGSMSAAVAAGLRLYVAQQNRVKEKTQMHQVEIEVQDGPVVTTKRFMGRELLRYEIRNGVRVVTFRTYVTARDQLAVHIRNDPDWTRFSSAADNNPVWDDERTWGTNWWDTTERALRVFTDVAAMRGELPDEVVDAVDRSLAQPAIEDLDI